jgi:ribosome biogenesis GTPase
MKKGQIIKALSGFYYVKADDGVYQCRGRGLFRKRKISPLVGDYVSFDINDPKEGYVTEIHARKNELIRPPVANIDQAIIVSSAVRPDFSSLLLDRFLVLIESKNIKPLIFITKTDAASDEENEMIAAYREDYRQIGYHAELLSTKAPDELTRLFPFFENNISVIAGQSGVGKSSLLNALNPSLLIKTDEISESLGRGKHTTRHVELVEVGSGLVADTPGFSSLDFNEIESGELARCFPEMAEREAGCRFRGCIHDREPGCAVKSAVAEGTIKSYRYEHYLNFLKEIQSRKPRY